MDILLDTSIAFERHSFLREGIQRARRQARQRPVLVSQIESIAEFDPITVFERGAAHERHLWSQPNADFALVGVGAAHAIEVFDSARFRQASSAWRHLLHGAAMDGPRDAPAVGPLLLGGFAFDAQRPTTPLWHDFGHGRLVLPRALFTRVNGEAWLTLNTLVTPQTDAADEAKSLKGLVQSLLTSPRGNNGQHAYGGNGHTPRPSTRALRSAAVWQTEVANAAQAIARGEMEKVVLARAVQLHASKAFDPARALRHLSTHYADCYVFAVARGARCFLGATPERLVHLHAGEVRTVSLAGSIRRGKTPAEDEQLGRTLLHSDKDRREQVVVTQALVEALDDLCSHVHVPETPTLLKLGNIQHLSTPITAQLINGHTLFELAERLHPTPAVGGRPREASLRWIREHEGLDRGWYAGPVGWVNAEGEGELAVALRSALLHGDAATLFAGCGIVADSDPEREYAEANLKLRPMLAALSAYSR